MSDCIGCDNKMSEICPKCKGKKWITIPEGRRPLNARESHLKPCNLCNAKILEQWMKNNG